MLVLKRKSVIKSAEEYAVCLFSGDKLLGRVTLNWASHGDAAIGFEFLPDIRIVREELCQLGGSDGKEAAA